GEIAFAADAIGLDDPALAEAVGTSATGTTALSWRSGGALKLTGLGLKGAGLAVTGDLSVAGPDTGLAVSGEVAAQVADLARFSSLAGRPLGGSADMTLAGEIGLLSGLLDVETTLAGHDLRVGQPELDQLLRGAARVEASVARDTDGIILRRLNATAQSLTAALSGRIATGSADLDARFAIADLSALGQTYGGTVSATANLTEAGGLRTVTLAATTKDVKTGQPAANQLLAGTSDLRLEADEREGKVLIRSFALSGQEITASGTGQLVDGRNQLDLTAKLRDIALFAPEFPGPLSLDGQVGETPTGYLVDLAAEGPGATSAQIKGALNADLGETDLRIAGSAQSALANAFIAPRSLSGPVRFDLAMVGPPALRSLSGRIDADGMRLVAPALGLDLRNMTAGAELSGATARLTLGAEVAGGGRLSLVGPVNLGAPYTADLALRLAAVRLRDPDLFDTSASGDLSITGPLTGGARIAGSIALGPTEVRIATTGLGGQNDIGAVLHVNEPAEVHRTRARAGLIDDGNGTGNGGAPYQLDLLISAPGRIFVRGRGLDAELGGALRVGGTTDNILPSGQFDLVRGRLDILAKRLTIDEGMIQLQGALQPYIRFAASTQSDGITATVLIEGEATEPDIRFTSVPELPEEEVIAQLLFGRDLSTLSPFQALRLASAVATLAGRGGDDIVTRLRNSFGLDDLDVISDEDGTASLKVGKYLSEKVYTDVTIGPEGKSEINLNLDVRPGLSVRGSLDQEGGTGIGLFYEKDY
ncbi:MAG: translocation/assembly module TamB domain-containing protein, partial [Rhodobacteraceae bacterium]|nr:translocation/assembly module TamB domain-containing protein [Paracoccaceae bacterium]